MHDRARNAGGAPGEAGNDAGLVAVRAPAGTGAGSGHAGDAGRGAAGGGGLGVQAAASGAGRVVEVKALEVHRA